MKHWKQWGFALALALNMIATAVATKTVSASECGLSCCIAAGVDGVGSSTGLSVSVQIDSMQMKTIRQGTSKITSQTVISNNLAARPNGAMYVAPTKMVMTKIATNFSYRLDEDDAFVVTVPYIINDMEMLKGMKMGGGVNYTSVTMDTIQGLGDISLLYIRDVWKDADIRTRKRLSLGVGLKAPTGKYQARNATNGRLSHMMMQAGTGAWDGVFLANGTLAFGEHQDGGAQWFVSPSLTYQLTTRNSLGYKVGNRLNYNVSTRYRATSLFNLKLDFNGVISAKDSTDGTIDTSGLVAYQNPNMSLIDNVNNTGIHSLFLTPGFQWLVAPSISISGEYRIPVYQNTKGIQQVTDNWFFLRVRKAF